MGLHSRGELGQDYSVSQLQRCGIENKENRSQNRRDSTAEGNRGRTTIFHSYSPSYVWEVGREPAESGTVFKKLEKNGMV